MQEELGGMYGVSIAIVSLVPVSRSRSRFPFLLFIPLQRQHDLIAQLALSPAAPRKLPPRRCTIILIIITAIVMLAGLLEHVVWGRLRSKLECGSRIIETRARERES